MFGFLIIFKDFDFLNFWMSFKDVWTFDDYSKIFESLRFWIYSKLLGLFDFWILFKTVWISWCFDYFQTFLICLNDWIDLHVQAARANTCKQAACKHNKLRITSTCPDRYTEMERNLIKKEAGRRPASQMTKQAPDDRRPFGWQAIVQTGTQTQIEYSSKSSFFVQRMFKKFKKTKNFEYIWKSRIFKNIE